MFCLRLFLAALLSLAARTDAFSFPSSMTVSRLRGSRPSFSVLSQDIASLVEETDAPEASYETGEEAETPRQRQAIDHTKSIFCANLPWSITEEEFKDWASTAGGEVISVSLPIDFQSNRPRGFGFVEFAEPEQRDEAVTQLEGQQLHGRSIVVRPNQPPEERPRRERRESNFAQRYEPRQRDDESELGRRVLVSNLPWRSAWQDVKDFFKQCGFVEHVECLRLPDGRSAGKALVVFRNPGDAEESIEKLNGASFFGRVCYVKMDGPSGGDQGQRQSGFGDEGGYGGQEDGGSGFEDSMGEDPFGEEMM
uniref:RRM domain-containing protein n=1 Tax=Chromera velia CCMP2878 TaxID=1169474 RepID=A0A0G4H9Y8_9ALVE|mmetsp:Transcript_45623/g.89877  ORF Transcript_45623/g.89877 Transcript_45623/m.89877 type:complete len:309 (+) Transcript_45623:90-1016(+)|eukprot:Cvel_907.t1-p1 / transcript=Cvel_907.t1 / gene=Cvel_907 / organism=Chromera_velia_CCMP2878 / gene_product=Protein HRB1, putative / transcript_product=Protein HRB1, putative / location=Cvel_scaffold28:173589-175423(+) / protein_length=308 / sequence_SO=supercontig / SO=protein_coding / is_pseudo=false